MKRFPLLISIAAALVWLLPVVGPFAAPARASVITTGDVDPGGAGTQPDPWFRASLYVGNEGTGTLNVESGGVVSSTYGYIGAQSGSTGVATVTGAGSQWNNSGSLSVGQSGSGTLNVEVGGVVSNTYGYIGRYADSTGVATVTGSGSQWTNSGHLRVGASGSGTLNVEAGGVVSNMKGYIGSSSGSTGEATVTGIGSQWNNGDLYVGYFGNGTLNVESGGVISSTLSGFIGVASSATGVATVIGSGSKWNNVGDLSVGEYGTGTLNVESGGVVFNTVSGFIGRYAGSTGAVTVTGSGSQWNNSGSTWPASGLYVGEYGNGTLNVEAGGVVSNDTGHIGMASAATGEVTVRGAGSQWNNLGGLEVGHLGTGTLKVEAGGVVSNTNGYVGRESSSTGAVIVTGSGSQWNNSDKLYVGMKDNGTLNIKAGGEVSNTKGYIGYSSDSTGVVTVNGSGSQWNNSGFLSVGYNGTGTLNVESGGQVSNTAGQIGYSSGSAGVATVTGSGSQWTNSEQLYVGRTGTGTLNVESGGVVSNLTGAIGLYSGSTGEATITGSNSTWSNSGGLYIGGDSLGSGGNGTLNIDDSGLVTVSDTTKLWSDGTINLDGGILDVGILDLTLGTFNMFDGHLGADSVVGDISIQGGVLAPGNSSETLSITGDYVQVATATLEIELGGTIRGDEYDAMIVGGDLTLNGNLNVLQFGGFVPQAGDLFDILDFESANLISTFNNVNLPALASDLEWDQSNLYTTGELLVSLSQIPGDFDSDVDGDDFLAWQNGFPISAGAALLDGDADADGDVDGDDFLLWQNSFPYPTAISSVPEPKSLALLALSGLLMLRRHESNDSYHHRYC